MLDLCVKQPGLRVYHAHALAYWPAAWRLRSCDRMFSRVGLRVSLTVSGYSESMSIVKRNLIGTGGETRTRVFGFGDRHLSRWMTPITGPPGWTRTITGPLLRRVPLRLDYGRITWWSQTESNCLCASASALQAGGDHSPLRPWRKRRESNSHGPLPSADTLAGCWAFHMPNASVKSGGE